MNDVWARTLRRVKRKVNQHSFDTWIRSMRFLGYRKGVLRLVASNDSHRNWVLDNYLSLIRVAATEVCKKDVQIEISVANGDRPAREPAVATRSSPAALPRLVSRRIVTGIPLTNGDLTFDNFVVGRSNEFALAACKKVAQVPAGAYNPLFIYGDPGLGKTHLLCAIANSLKRTHPDLSVLYKTAEDFTNELIDSIASRQMASFRLRYRSVDVLLLDDIQFIQDKNKTQEALFYTFNALYKCGRQIVISGDRLPTELNSVQQKLISRLTWGLVVDLEPPDLKTKIAILHKKASASKIALPADVAHYIAVSSGSSVRELEGMLTTVRAYSELRHVPITLQTAKIALRQYRPSDSLSPLCVEAIQRRVARYYGIRLEHLVSRDRTRSTVRARQVAMFLCREMLKESYPSIGKTFSGMCHAAVIHSCQVVSRLLKTDPVMRRAVESIRADLLRETES